MAEIVLSVSQLNDYVAGVFGHDPLLRKLKVKGEVSGYKAQAPHAYFSLKDSSARVACVVFNAPEKLDAPLQDGMLVTVSGFVALYTPGGQYQINVQSVEAEGEGELFLRFARLQRELARRGWFDEARKRALPAFPRCVGIATSLTGAAVRDIIAVGTRRWPLARLILCGTQVQGAGAAECIVQAIHRLERMPCEVIVVGRGGGAAEDLAAFNDEAVARAIFECRVPVVSAVGHETDYTIADFVADMRAPTPSAAMELCLPDAQEVAAHVHALRKRLYAAAVACRTQAAAKLRQLRRAVAVRRPEMQHMLARQKLASQKQALRSAAARTLSANMHQLQLLEARLQAASPYTVLQRGYTLVYDASGEPVARASLLTAGQMLRVQWADGEAAVTVDTVTYSG